MARTPLASNIGYSPITASGQLTRDRISHVDQNYLRMETYALANTPLIEAQAGIELAQAWAAGWSPRSTGCGSWCRSRRSTPARIRNIFRGARAQHG